MMSHRAITTLVCVGLALCGLASSAAAQSVTRPVIEALTIARPEAPKAPNLALQNLPEPPDGGGVLSRVRTLAAETKAAEEKARVAEARAVQLSAEISGLKAKETILRSQINNMTIRQSALESENGAENAKIADLTAEINRAKKEADQLSAEQQMLKDRAFAQTAEIQTLKQQLTTSRQALTEASAQNRDLIAEAGNLKNRLEDLKSERHSLTGKAGGLASRLAAARAENTNLLADKNALEDRAALMTAENIDLRDRIGELVGQVNDLQTQATELDAKQSVTAKGLAGQTRASAALEGELQRARAALASAVGAERAAAAELAKTSASADRIQQLEEQLSGMEANLASAYNERAGLQEDLEIAEATTKRVTAEATAAVKAAEDNAAAVLQAERSQAASTQTLQANETASIIKQRNIAAGIAIIAILFVAFSLLRRKA